MLHYVQSEVTYLLPDELQLKIGRTTLKLECRRLHGMLQLSCTAPLKQYDEFNVK